MPSTFITKRVLDIDPVRIVDSTDPEFSGLTVTVGEDFSPEVKMRLEKAILDVLNSKEAK